MGKINFMLASKHLVQKYYLLIKVFRTEVFTSYIYLSMCLDLHSPTKKKANRLRRRKTTFTSTSNLHTSA